MKRLSCPSTWTCLVMAALLFSGCGRHEDKANADAGWVTIYDPTTNNQYLSDADTIHLAGSAFVSPTGSSLDYDWTNYRYIGHTGVTVTWKNETIDVSGGASEGFDVCYGGSEFFPLVSLCDTTWNADVPLAMGANLIAVSASDGAGNDGSVSITITRIVDVTPPVVISTSPSPGTAEVPGGASISATFSEAMDPSSLNGSTFVISDEGDNRITGAVSTAGSTVIFVPAVYLEGNMTYTARITTGAKDRAGGNFLKTEYAWSFTIDSASPAIVGNAPQGSGVAVNSVIIVDFSEDMDPATITAASFIVKDGNADLVAGAVAYASKKATFTPLQGLKNAELYTATTTSAITDLAGNPLQSDYSWTFYTNALETGSWQPILPPNYTTYRWHVTTAWTDHELIILDTACPGKYDYINHAWGDISKEGAPPVALSKAVWTGADVIVWGGYDDTKYLNSGGIYDPSTDAWKTVSLQGPPSARNGHTAVWTGTEMIVWGGYDGVNYLNTGGKYDPVSDTWKQISPVGAPSARNGHTAVWTGTEMIVWGGYDGVNYLNTGGKYDPVSDTWKQISPVGAPSARNGHTAVWTGTEMIVWGGYDGANYLNTGAKYDPVSDTWKQISPVGAPSARSGHTAVWSGIEMIIWGGDRADPGSWNLSNTGGLYNPATNGWRATATTSAPYARTGHAATWSGSTMFIWGGRDYIWYRNDGGEYTP